MELCWLRAAACVEIVARKKLVIINISAGSEFADSACARRRPFRSVGYHYNYCIVVDARRKVVWGWTRPKIVEGINAPEPFPGDVSTPMLEPQSPR